MPTSTLLIILVVLLGLMALIVWRNRVKTRMERSYNMVFLKVMIPRKESEKDKQESMSGVYNEGFREAIGVMDQLFSNLHSIYKNRVFSFLYGTDYISLEYVFIDEQVTFFVVVPRKLAKLMEKQITSFYTEAVVEEVDDYNLFQPESKQASTYLTTSKNYAYSIKTYKTMESDPLNSLVNSLSKLEKDETGAVQIMVRPVKSGWQKKCKREASKLQGGKRSSFSLNPLSWLSSIMDMFVGGETTPSPDKKESAPLIEDTIKALGEKSGSLGYEVIIRIIASAPTKEQAVDNVVNIRSAFSQFSVPEVNELKYLKHHRHRFGVTNFIYRNFKKGFLLRLRPKMILSCTELASLYHLPSTKYNKIDAIQWQNYKIAAAPKNIPKEGTLLGYNIYRGVKTPIYITPKDRFRHFYVIGQTGTGKSTMLTNMVFQDLEQNQGFCVMDPHGQLAEDIFPYIPRERADDIVYFNPADTERPLGLNLLEGKDEEEKELVAMDAMNIMIKLFGNEIFGPRIQDYFRNGCLTLMSDPEGAALTDIVRLFTDETYQQYKVKKVKNPVVKAFWEKQMAQTGKREKQEMIPYFAAKFGQFSTNSLMRNIIGQAKSSFDVAEVMQEGKILLINLSKGLIGDINSDLLGMIVVAKIQTAAMRRQKLTEEERRPFFLYIDEFQNYVTDAIESILSEARKYKLSLNIAHQYLDQLEKQGGKGQGNLDLKSAIFGNVGTIMSYKIGAKDGEYMEKEMTPVFTQQDLVNIDKFKAVIKLSIQTQPSRPFSIIPRYPFDYYEGDKDVVEAFKQLSRLKFGRDRDFVSREILHRMGSTDTGTNTSTPTTKPPVSKTPPPARTTTTSKTPLSAATPPPPAAPQTPVPPPPLASSQPPASSPSVAPSSPQEKPESKPLSKP